MKALIKVGYSCNNNCVFCHEYENRGTDLKKEVIQKAILKSKAYGCDSIVFSGGEPSIRKDFTELIGFASSNNINSEIVTNARMFKIENFAKECSRKGLKTAHVSLLGSKPEVHDGQTKVQGSFNQTVLGIKNLLKSEVDVKVNVVVNRYNLYDLKNITKLCNKLSGIESIKFSFVEPKGKALTDFDRIVPSMQEASKEILKAVSYTNDMGIKAHIEGLPPCLTEDYKKEIYNLKKEGVYIRFDANKKTLQKVDLITDNEKTKPKRCKECLDYNTCDGAFKVYLNKKGDQELRIKRE